jgi:hypothetical protein
LENFNFHNLHHQVLIGTASDRYAGWIGQIYLQDRYAGRIIKRTKIIAGKTFNEEVLPVKVPQLITAQKIRRGEQYLENEAYLNPNIFKVGGVWNRVVGEIQIVRREQT